MERIRELLEKD